MLVAGGSTNVTTYWALRLAADGTAATGLTVTNFDLQYTRSGVAPTAKVDATALGATDTAHTDNYAIEIDATDQPGLYRVDWPDAAFAAGVREVILSVKCATAFTEHLRVEIDGEVNVVEWAGTDVVAGAIPAAAADAAGGLPISDGGGLDMDAILADTNELQSDDIPGKIVTLDAVVDTVKVDTAAILVDTGTTLDGKINTIDGIVDAILVDTGTTLDGKITTIDGIVDSILVDTGTTLDGKITTIDGIVDSILVDTGTTLQAELDAIQAAVITNAAGSDIAADIIAIKAETATIVADTNELQSDDIPGKLVTLDAVVDTVKAETVLILADTGTTLDTKINTIDTVVDAIKVQTDKLTFTSGTDLDANIQKVNDVTVAGTGASGDEWGPA